MALEIGEIGVRMAVSDHNEKYAAPTPHNQPGQTPALRPDDRAQIIQECVREVLQAMHKLTQR
ncbi:DUF5908 family protein [Glaciimonas sp. GG7]